jgi:anti-anti-sigma regulatory factor
MRLTVAIDLELSHGKDGASARIEMFERTEGAAALVALSGWIEPVAGGRLIETLSGLAARGVRHLVLDCSRVRHIDFPLIAPLAHALAGFEAFFGTASVRGLSPHLRDLFRLSGSDPDSIGLRRAVDPVTPHSLEAEREWAS